MNGTDERTSAGGLLADVRPRPAASAHHLDEHTSAVLTELGCISEEIAALQDEGAV